MAAQRYFYQRKALATLIGSTSTRLMHTRPQVAQLTYGHPASTQLLQVDRHHSILGSGSDSPGERRSYTAQGYQRDTTGSVLTGFNGQYLDLPTRGYVLGQGRRLYAPQRGSMCSPDPLSPFGEGGINAYAYCKGDPVNYEDPTGFMRSPVLSLRSMSSRRPNVILHPPVRSGGSPGPTPLSPAPRRLGNRAHFSSADDSRSSLSSIDSSHAGVYFHVIPPNDSPSSSPRPSLLEASGSSTLPANTHLGAAALNQPVALPQPDSRPRSWWAQRSHNLRRPENIFYIPFNFVRRYPIQTLVTVGAIAGGITLAVLLARKGQ